MCRGGILLLVCGALAVAGCGSSDDEGTSSTAAKPTPAKTQPPADGSSGAEAVNATIKDFSFTPQSVEVSAGGSVTWTDEDASNHSVTFDDKSVESIDNLREGQNGKVSFAEAGTYAYVCTYHPGMKGKVVVK